MLKEIKRIGDGVGFYLHKEQREVYSLTKGSVIRLKLAGQILWKKVKKSSNSLIIYFSPEERRCYDIEQGKVLEVEIVPN